MVKLLFSVLGRRIGIALHYCNPLGAVRSCEDGETAMVMEGGNIPERIRSVNCKCQGQDPMKIKKSYMVGWKWNHDLVCDMVGGSSNQLSDCLDVFYIIK